MAVRNLYVFLLSVWAGFASVSAQDSALTGGIVGPIGVSDTVTIDVFRESDLATSGQLNRQGEISMPLIGTLKNTKLKI